MATRSTQSAINGEIFGQLSRVVIAEIAMALVAIALVTGASHPVRAEGALTMPLPADIGTCKDLCPTKGIQFEP